MSSCPLPSSFLLLLAIGLVGIAGACSKDARENAVSPPEERDMRKQEMAQPMDMPADLDGGRESLDQERHHDDSLSDQGDSDFDSDLGDDPPDVEDMTQGGCNEPLNAIHVSTKLGDDAATGSASAPFQTIARALRDITPGQHVVVHEGVYHEAIIPTSSGTEGAPIVITAACGEKPVLDGSRLTTSDGLPALIKIIDQSHLVVGGFELRNVTAARSDDFPSAIWIRGASHHIELRSNEVHDVTAWRGGQQSGAHGIAVYGTSTSPAHAITLKDNHVHDLTLGWSEAVVINGNVRDFLVLGNTVEDVNNIAFDFIGFEQDVCPGCDQSDRVEGDTLNRVRQGLIKGNVARRVSSAGNPAYGQDKSAGCFYVDGGADLVFEQNLATRCDIGLELASEAAGKSTRQILVRNNLLHDLDVTGIATGGYDPGNGPGGGAASDCVIVHNTIVNASEDGWADAAIVLQNRNIGNRYQNNIIIASPGTSAIADYGEKNEGNVFSHNLYQGAFDGVSAGEGSIAQPARFQDAAAHDYRLQSTSPAIDAATVLPASLQSRFDFAGIPRPQGSAPDIGAYEYRAP